MANLEVRAICVFCGASTGSDPLYARAARELGTLMATQGITLVYGGGNAGIMGTIANAALKAGGEVIGVIPDYLVEREHGHREVTRLDIVDSMHERKRRMFDLSDGFLSLPGGVGTLEETFEVITWKQLGMHAKPIVILNTKGYWTKLDEMIEATIEHEFAAPPTRELYSLADTPKEALDRLRAMGTSAAPSSSARL